MKQNQEAKPTKRVTLTFHHDPGHGWLTVPHKLLMELGIVDKITRCSYMTLTRAHLEEDLDAGIFEKAAERAGIEITIRDKYADFGSRIRDLASYHPFFIRNEITPGFVVVLFDGTRASVSSSDKKYLFLSKEQGAPCYRASKRKFLSLINLPATAEWHEGQLAQAATN